MGQQYVREEKARVQSGDAGSSNVSIKREAQENYDAVDCDEDPSPIPQKLRTKPAYWPCAMAVRPSTFSAVRKTLRWPEQERRREQKPENGEGIEQ
jgi:hypothetical protein